MFENHQHTGASTGRISQDDIVPSIRASGSIAMETDGQTYSLGVISNPTQILFYGNAVNTNLYTFNIASTVNAHSGAVYSNNGETFTLPRGVHSDTTMAATGTGAPTSSGTLTKVSGTGDATIDFSSVSSPGLSTRAFVVGSAQLGKSFYFQPQSSNSVVTGGLPETIIQSSSYFLCDNSNPALPVFRTSAGEFHLVSVAYPNQSTIVARATVTEFAIDHVSILVQLADGWTINGNFVVT